MIQRSLGPGSRNKASIAEKYLPTVDVVNAKRLRKNFSGGSMAEPIIIIPYDKEWSLEFQRVGSILRETLGSIAIRIDHIGSTSIVGMDAKPIVDIQISVEYLEPMIYRPMMESVGQIFRADNLDKTKRYFREGAGMKRIHIHVREKGSWSEQFALLFRDFLREHEEYRKLYAKEKYMLMNRYQNERHLYVEGKSNKTNFKINNNSKNIYEAGDDD